MGIVIPRYCLAVTTAEELKNWPVPMYQGEELKKVREWEKTWAGKKINQDNIAQLKDFFSEQYYNVFANPKDWGTDEPWFDIVPYQKILPGTPKRIPWISRGSTVVIS